MNNLAIKGHVLVQVEDTQGRVKQRVEADNALSPAALRTMLYCGLTKFTTSGQTVFGFGGGLAVSQQVNVLGSPMFGVYALQEPFDWSKNSKHWIKPPYCTENFASLSDAVLYYHTGDNAVEASRLMVRSVQRSYFEAAAKFRAEYMKSVGLAGTIRSIAVGTAHSALTNSFWGTAWNEPVPNNFFTTALGTAMTCGIALEHKIDRTIAHCRGGTNYYTYDFKTQDIVVNTATAELTSGYLVHTTADGTRIGYSASNSGTPSTSEHSIELQTSFDWNAPVTRVLTPPNITAGSLDINRRALPVLVMRPDTKTIEVFLSLDHNKDGCRLVKAVIDAARPQTSEVSWIEMGRIPYIIGQINAVNRLIGYYDTETQAYWLPYTGIIGADGICTSCTSALTGTGVNQNVNFIPGVKLHAREEVFNHGTYDSERLLDYYIARITAQEGMGAVHTLDIVQTSQGILQGHFRDQSATNRNYRDYGVVFSAVNLPAPVFRDADDVLRLVYTYQLGNA